MTTLTDNAILRAYRAKHKEHVQHRNDAEAVTSSEHSSPSGDEDGFQDIIASKPVLVRRKRQSAAVLQPASVTRTTLLRGIVAPASSGDAVSEKGAGDAQLPSAVLTRVAATLAETTPASLAPSTRNESHPLTAVSVSEMSIADDVPTTAEQLGEVRTPLLQPRRAVLTPRARVYDVDAAASNEDAAAVRCADPAGVRPITFWHAIAGLHADSAAWTRHGGDSSSSDVKPVRSRFSVLSRLLLQCSGSRGQHTVDARVGAAVGESSRGGANDDDAVFVEALKKMPLDHGNELHRRLLHTIYALLACAAATLPAWATRRSADVVSDDICTDGVRWSVVGFQGSDPATDLRATGLLGLLHVLYLLDFHPSLAATLWGLCNPTDTPVVEGETTNLRPTTPSLPALGLPYVLVCFNVTALVLDARARGLLRRRESTYTTHEAQRECDTASTERMAADATASYCAPSAPELRSVARHPAVMASSEYFVGCVALFCQMWRKMQRAHAGAAAPSVADFGPTKDKLRRAVLSRKGASLVYRATDALKQRQK